MLTFEQIKELIELVSEHGLGGVEIERSGFRIKIDAAPPAAAAAPAARPAGAASEPAPEAPAPPVDVASPAEPASGEPAADAGRHLVKSPIVGTFYSAPSPDSEPYVQVGKAIKKGQVLCIIEAMKLMNEIESDVDGELVEIFPENAQPVEFGAPLFAIRTR